MPISQTPPKETILVVDDELEVLALVADILHAKGYTVLRASDPREALRLARTQSDPIHLLVTDVVMPFMNGRELAEELRTIRPGVKVLFMSAYTTDVVEDYGIRVAPSSADSGSWSQPDKQKSHNPLKSLLQRVQHLKSKRRCLRTKIASSASFASRRRYSQRQRDARSGSAQ